MTLSKLKYKWLNGFFLRIVTKFAIIVAMNRIRVSRRVEKKLAKGLVLLEASDLTDIDLTDQAVEVLSQDGKF